MRVGCVFDIENNKYLCEPMEKFTTAHPVKRQTREVSGLYHGCKGEIEVNG